nr:uncharacterized protein LOC109158503 [Ipomoea batatas]
MNTKTLSSQRSSEDLDLLERSTKKSKHIARGPADSAMEIVEETPQSSGVGNEDMESEEVVAETPVGDQGAIGLNGSASDPAEAIPATSDLGKDGHTSVPIADEEPAIPHGGVPARSYLDTVVGTGTEANARVNEEAAADRDRSRGHSGENDGSAEERRVPLAGNRPYGSWMIVTRKERRQQGRPAGQTHPGETTVQGSAGGRQKEIPTGTGSRFALLGNDDEQEGYEQQAETVALGGHQNRAQPTGLGGRSRRSNVIASEKQIQNEVHTPRAVPTNERNLSTGRRSSGACSRRAAEEDEHVVIRGEQGGKVTSTTVVHPDDAEGSGVNDVPAMNQPTSEHHADPPGAIDEEGDVIMEVDNLQKDVGDDGGDARPLLVLMVGLYTFCWPVLGVHVTIHALTEQNSELSSTSLRIHVMTAWFIAAVSLVLYARNTESS